MKPMLAVPVLALTALTAQGGVLKVATFPVVHFKKTFKAVEKVVTYPVVHPKKTVF